MLKVVSISHNELKLLNRNKLNPVISTRASQSQTKPHGDIIHNFLHVSLSTEFLIKPDKTHNQTTIFVQIKLEYNGMASPLFNSYSPRQPSQPE